MRRVAALGAAASALFVARVFLALAPGLTVRIATQVNNPNDARPVENPRDPRPVLNPRHPRPVNAARIRDLCWAITAIAARTPFSATCLEQAVALVLLLTIARVPSNLVIGVARSDAAFRAHAWVESGGVVVLGGAQARGLVPLVRMSRATTISSPPSPVSASCPG